MGQHVVIDAAALAAHLLDRQTVILRGPGDHGVGGQGQAPGLLGLALEVACPDHALVGIQQVAAQGVQRFALVELAGDTATMTAGVPPASERSASWTCPPN
jgi:hypothetical protein